MPRVKASVATKRQTTRQAAPAERLTPAQVLMQRPRLLLNQEEAADELGIGLTFFKEERDAGRISVVNIGRRQLVPYASLVAYVRRLCEEQGVPLDEMALAG